MAAPVTTGPVLPRPQEILSSLVVGMLVEDPETFQNVAGVNITVAEALVHVGAVVHELHHVSHEVRPVVDPHLVGSSVLCVRLIKIMVIIPCW